MLSGSNPRRPAPHIERVKSPASSRSSLKQQVVQQPERVRTMSEKSAEQSQGSHLSYSSAGPTVRSPKHPDLTSNFRSSTGLLVPSLHSEQPGSGGPFGNRLSTIPDVDDLEEMDGDSSEKQAAVEWAGDHPESASWDFLRLVQEYRKQRQEPGQDGTFVPPPRSEARTEDQGDYSLPHEFPPAVNILPTPLSGGKPLPPLPKSPSTVGRIIRGIPLYEDLDTTDDDKKLNASVDDGWRPIVIQTPLMLRSPALPPLPPSETSGHSTPQRVVPHSSAGTARGSTGALPLDALHANAAPAGPGTRSRRSAIGSRSRASWAGSDGGELVAELTILAEATCFRCGRVFSGRETLQRHRTYCKMHG